MAVTRVVVIKFIAKFGRGGFAALAAPTIPSHSCLIGHLEGRRMLSAVPALASEIHAATVSQDGQEIVNPTGEFWLVDVASGSGNSEGRGLHRS